MGTEQTPLGCDDNDLPLRLGSPEDFERVKKALTGSGFEEPAIHQVLQRAGVAGLGRESSPKQPSSRLLRAVAYS
jgi:hypothetical protein